MTIKSFQRKEKGENYLICVFHRIVFWVADRLVQTFCLSVILYLHGHRPAYNAAYEPYSWTPALTPRPPLDQPQVTAQPRPAE